MTLKIEQRFKPGDLCWFSDDSSFYSDVEYNQRTLMDHVPADSIGLVLSIVEADTVFVIVDGRIGYVMSYRLRNVHDRERWREHKARRA